MINLALDTNMLGLTPWGGPIFHESHGNRGGSAGDEERDEVHKLTREELDEHTHENTIQADSSRRWQPVQHNP